MGSYVESALIKNENIVYQGRISIWSLLPFLPLAAIGIASLLFSDPRLGIVVATLCLAPAPIRYYTTELAITNKRIIAKTGLIRRTTVEINIHRVEAIQVSQGILGRIFNYGSIVVSGSGAPQAPILGISSPLNFRRAFLHTQEEREQSLA